MAHGAALISVSLALMPGFHHSVAISPFPLAVAVSVHRCRCMPLPLRIFLPFTAVTERNFLYVIFTEQRNFTTAKRQRKNGNGMVETWHQPSDTSLHCETTDAGLVYRAVCPAFAGAHCAYPRRDGQAELTRVAGYIPRWFTRPQTVTHPSTNGARRRVTSLIETNAFPLSQTSTVDEGDKVAALQMSKRSDIWIFRVAPRINRSWTRFTEVSSRRCGSS